MGKVMDALERHLGRPLKVKAQGKVIVERVRIDGGFLVMFPDGRVQWLKTKAAVEKGRERVARSEIHRRC
jgi:hypothetical protein